MLLLKSVSFISFILTPSNSISPLVGSNIRVIKLNKVDLPCPDLPTIAIFLFGFKVILKLFNVLSSFG